MFLGCGRKLERQAWLQGDGAICRQVVYEVRIEPGLLELCIALLTVQNASVYQASVMFVAQFDAVLRWDIYPKPFNTSVIHVVKQMGFTAAWGISTTSSRAPIILSLLVIYNQAGFAARMFI